MDYPSFQDPLTKKYKSTIDSRCVIYQEIAPDVKQLYIYIYILIE